MNFADLMSDAGYFVVAMLKGLMHSFLVIFSPTTRISFTGADDHYELLKIS